MLFGFNFKRASKTENQSIHSTTKRVGSAKPGCFRSCEVSTSNACGAQHSAVTLSERTTARSEARIVGAGEEPDGGLVARRGGRACPVPLGPALWFARAHGTRHSGRRGRAARAGAFCRSVSRSTFYRYAAGLTYGSCCISPPRRTTRAWGPGAVLGSRASSCWEFRRRGPKRPHR